MQVVESMKNDLLVGLWNMDDWVIQECNVGRSGLVKCLSSHKDVKVLANDDIL